MRVAAALLQAAATYMRPEEVRLAGARGGWHCRPPPWVPCTNPKPPPRALTPHVHHDTHFFCKKAQEKSAGHGVQVKCRNFVPGAVARRGRVLGGPKRPLAGARRPRTRLGQFGPSTQGWGPPGSVQAINEGCTSLACLNLIPPAQAHHKAPFPCCRCCNHPLFNHVAISGPIGPKLKLVGGEMTFVCGAAMRVRDPSGACLGCKRTLM